MVYRATQQQRQGEPLSDCSAAVPAHDALLSRRHLLLVGTGVAAAVAMQHFGGRATASQEAGPTAPMPREAADATPRRERQDQAFPQPLVLHSKDGVLEATLRVAQTQVPLWQATGPRLMLTRAYNDSVPGPTLRVRARDQLRLLLINDLPLDQPFCDGAWDEANRPHGFNVTNLHTHGLHVSPASRYSHGTSEPDHPGASPVLASDDVSLAIGPGARQQYCLWLPAFHAPGTYWYHPHKHGSVALQVVNGLVGALIVEEEPGHEIVRDARDVVWVIHELEGENAAAIYTQNPPLPKFYINGASQPTLTMRPGELQRWRFINATGTPAGYGEITLLDNAGQVQPLHLVAVDGITFYGKAPQRKLAWVIPPGGRADFLVQLSQAGRYQVIKDTVRDVPATFRQELAFVEVAGVAMTAALPARLPGASPGYLEPILQATEQPAKVRFRIGRRRPGARVPCDVNPNDFEINEKKYQPGLIDHTVSLNAVEQWELTNSSSMLHPFHIHLNPFQVVDGPDHLIDPQAPDTPDNWIWRDTVGIPVGTPEKPGKVRIRTRFLTYHGRYVLHCHFLDHEDLGMMQNVLVHGAGAPPCTPVERSH
jgi:FtsP/CotA-like multicopper oxidase with cupredoxin domain